MYDCVGIFMVIEVRIVCIDTIYIYICMNDYLS